MVDRLMMGFASGVGSTSMLVPTLGLKLFTTQLHISPGAIIGIAQAAPAALVAGQWLFIRRGGMISRGAVAGLWAFAALGLVGIALTRAHGWLTIPIVAACMTAVGAGQSAGYHVQNNKLGAIEENNSGHSPGGRAPTAGVSTASSLVQQWTLLFGIASSFLLAFAMERFGVRLAIMGLAVVVATFAILHFIWGGLPEAKRGVDTGAVSAMLWQSAEVKRDLYGNFVLYGAWGGALYPILALIGAGPLVQASISTFARGTAAVFVAWIGRMADTGRQRVLRVAASLAVGGAILLALSRSNLDWTVAGLGVVTTEIGCNGVGQALKGSLAQDPERVRLMHAGTLFRFAGQGLCALSVAIVWLVFSRQSVELARSIVTVGLVGLLIAVLRIVPQVVRRPGTHPMKVDDGDGKIVLAVLPAAAHAPTSRWFYVGAAGRWGSYELHHEELLKVVGRKVREKRLLELHASTHTRSSRLHRRRGRHRRERRTIPPVVPGVPWRSLKLVDFNDGGPVVATLFASKKVRATVERLRMKELPDLLQEKIAHGPPAMRPDIDRAGTVIYCVLKDASFRGRLRIESQNHVRDRSTQSPAGDQHSRPEGARQRRRAGRRRLSEPAVATSASSSHPSSGDVGWPGSSGHRARRSTHGMPDATGTAAPAAPRTAAQHKKGRVFIRDPERLAALLSGWERYVGWVALREEPDARHYRLDLTGKVPGLDWSRLASGRVRKGKELFCDVHIAPAADPGTVAVTIDASWRDRGELGRYERWLPRADDLEDVPAVTFAERDRCDPLILPEALAYVIEVLDRM